MIFEHFNLEHLPFTEGTNYILKMIQRAIDDGLKTMCFWVGPLPYIVALDVDDVRVCKKTRFAFK